ncbi:non-ribosomal peptide synthetase [Paenibacillus crassostreae]|uniref:Thioester reductase n=1 Tax=Paenibacillus crassostreae TaxID=1763538 RepID=A0A167B803_9BACL|nr:non-ribosomal peptide synthetase [Paenibacillus crassostreae]AOZ93093.1 thioester reductase [Paenibacillus crassostreae]OAB71818.1 thioester reductase [Paenibacillus crassostreae]
MLKAILNSETKKDYWVRELQTPLSALDMYTDFPKHLTSREVQKTTLKLEINSDETIKLKHLGDMSVWMLSCYFVFLYRMTGERDLIVGVNDAIGNVIPLRVIWEGDISFQQLCNQITEKLNTAYEVSAPLSEIEQLTGQSSIMRTIYGEDDTVKDSDLNWIVRENAGVWITHITYHKNLFKESTILKFSRHFEYIVKATLANNTVSIGSIPILTEEDMNAYAELNSTNKEWSEMLTIPAMFASAVEKYSNHVALSSDEGSLTYSQLDRLSNQVAHMLVQKGVTKGEFVAIFMERSMDAIVSMLGVLKAGGAYIPLDPEHPDDRNSYIITDTQSHIVITKENFTSKLQELLSDNHSEVSIFCLDKQLDVYPDSSVDVIHDPEDMAYVIYTSGSTGKPKGAMIAHAGVVNLALGTKEDLQFNEDDIMLQYSTFSFDASVYDMYSSLCSGARLHILNNEQRFSIESFTAAIEEVKATRLCLLPTVFFNQLSAHLSKEDALKYSVIKSLVVGGEALSGESVRVLQKKLDKNIMIQNVYGPTEVTALTTGHIIDYIVAEDVSSIPIGKPLTNYEVLIVNENNQPCPLNVMGEMLISSVGIAKGYLNLQEKTNEVFISDPIYPNSGKRYYRSGDMVMLQENGIQYVSRKDFQVKIRGYRIEIGEIEENLIKHENIKETAIIAKAEADGTKYLVAFYTTKNGEAIAKSELVQYLNKKVPSYMVPSHFYYLAEMPVSPTAKIDRKQLARYEVEVTVEENADYVAPRNELEQTISEAWEKAINRTHIGIHDDFFEVGGHSLKILEILVILKPQYPQLKINDFFAFPTIAKLAERVVDLQNTIVIQNNIADSTDMQNLEEFPKSFGTHSSSDVKVYSNKHVLLTGATGYLGSHLLYELIQRSEATVYCLVRSSGNDDPYQRLVGIMKNYFGDSIGSKLEGRVIAIQGDLEKENLGLIDEVAALLQDKIDSIIHCAAEVKHFGDAEYFARVNVESTNRLLSFARGKEHVRFHFVSTLGIPEDLALSDQWNTFAEQDAYDYSVSIENVYTNSKLEAEKLVVRTCEEEGVAATVYRVGNLSCHSETGAFQNNINNNAFYRMLKAMLLLKKAPQVRWQVDLTPINYAGQAITALALSDDTVGKMFHICNPVQIPYEEMIESFHKYGYDITLLDWEQYESWLFDSSQPKEQTGLELAMAQLEGDGAKNSIYRFACPQTTDYLQKLNVACQVPDEGFFQRLIEHAIAVDYFDKP